MMGLQLSQLQGDEVSKTDRQERLAEQLRANLKKRRQQARARAQQAVDEETDVREETKRGSESATPAEKQQQRG